MDLYILCNPYGSFPEEEHFPRQKTSSILTWKKPLLIQLFNNIYILVMKLYNDIIYDKMLKRFNKNKNKKSVNLNI